MKISNSKKQLAKIISENGGWRDGAKFAAQDIDGDIFFYETKPTRFEGVWQHQGVLGGDWINCGKALPNWHQTIVSRDEYFHLYPAPDADGWIEWKGGACPVDDDVIVEVFLRKGRSSLDGPKKASRWDWSNDGDGGDIIKYRLHKPAAEIAWKSDTRTMEMPKPTIEQLAAEYRNRQDYAERKQQEADAAKEEAKAKLKELVAAGKAVGLVVSVAKGDDNA